MSAPFPAIDVMSARLSERLSSFLTEWNSKDPIDQYFSVYPALDYIMKNYKSSQDGGAQIGGLINIGESPNFGWAQPYDVVGSNKTDYIRPPVYDFVQSTDNLVISEIELREIAGKDHMLCDRVKAGRSRILKTLAKQYETALFAVAQAADKITCLPIAVDNSGTCGSISATTVSQWASQEASHAGVAFAVGGYERMIDMRNTLQDIASTPDVIILPSAIHKAIETQWDTDVRYGKSSDLSRGITTKLMFSDIPLLRDASCTSQTMYFLNGKFGNIEYRVDSGMDMRFDPFKQTEQGFVMQAKFINRSNLVIWDRRAQGKITNIA